MENGKNNPDLMDGGAIPLSDRVGVEPPAVEIEYREAIEQLRNFLNGACGRPLNNSEMIRYKREWTRLADVCDQAHEKLLQNNYSKEDILRIWNEGKNNEGIRPQ